MTRIHRAQMGHDLKRVGTLVLLPPLLVASYITACGILGFVGAQIWLEYFAMRPGRDKDAIKAAEWGWETEEDWSGGKNGGTDPSLGTLARIAIRSAWLFNTWAGQMGQQNVYSRSKTSSASTSYIQSALLGSTDRAHALAEQSLAWALEYMDQKHPDRPVPHSLLLRHADILEHIGTLDTVNGARREVFSVYRELPRGSYERSRLALRLGSLHLAEGGKRDAIRLWSEALNVQPSGEGATYSPAEERLIADTYLQLSALYSTDSRLDQASEIQEKAWRTIDSFIRPDPLGKHTDDGNAEKSLHALYLKHRAVVLSIHAAEVNYAQTRNVQSTLSQLEAATEQAGAVARRLTTNDQDGSVEKKTAIQSTTRVPAAHLSDAYSESNALQVPATSLLRDARRAVMQALVLKGLLLESSAVEGSGSLQSTRMVKAGVAPDPLLPALAAYEKALEWAGTTLKAAEALGVPEQEVLHVRMRAEGLQRRIRKGTMMLEQDR